METLFIYLLKSSGLVTLFFLAYYFLLRKETFFTSNRWFLLVGLITSAILPLLVFTKTVWVEPSPTTIDWSQIPVGIPVEKTSFEMDWFLTAGIVYALGIVAFLTRFGLDYYSLTKVFKGKTVHQQADFRFIDVEEKLAPFSFFNTIVYNSTLYSVSELQYIIEHEKVHSEQNHSIDVLLTRLFSILFWFNPLIWLYQKAILQNLEFIADSEALLKISDKKGYQITLLKITAHENCVALSNHFYQSLIKKRIIMLNKNQSNKRNLWKYAIVVPALVAFFMLFQVNVVAQEKAKKTKTVNVITKSADMGKDLESSQVQTDTVKKTITVNVTKKENGEEVKTIYIDGKKASQAELDALDSKVIKTMNVNKNGKESTIKIITKNSNGIPDDTEIFVDEKKISKEELDELDSNLIESMDVSKNGKAPTIKIITKNYNDISDSSQLMIGGVNMTELNLEKIDPKNINNLQTSKTTRNIKIIAKQKNGIQYETEIYIDGIKSDKTELDKIDPGIIERMDINKSSTGEKIIKVITKKEKQ
ncbi:M56 family metallopeptidase [Flavobacterium sp. W22_SRS_FP1]|uniref:M56 family metallopeptidase n=1 Tax=Flavobacterium sp. W22_SRS_FP1 TaxID=3240276 RepID=UPI003F8EC95D